MKVFRNLLLLSLVVFTMAGCASQTTETATSTITTTLKEITTTTITKTITPEPLTSAWCQEVVNKLLAILPADIPPSLLQSDHVKTGGEFDVNTYFSILTHLSMEEGYVLDYVYYFDGWSGNPILYVRPANQLPYKHYHEWRVIGEDSGEYGKKVKTDGTKQGYCEYIILQMLGSQFYLNWHSNYNDIRIACESSGLEKVFSEVENLLKLLRGSRYQPIDESFKDEARKIDLQPTVEINGDDVIVKVVTFSKWGGFSRYSHTINRSYPHTIIKIEKEKLLYYDCGITF